MSDAGRVVVIGVGTMGRGIAQVAAAAGYEVAIHDVSEEALQQGLDALRASVDRGVAKGKLTPEQRGAILRRVSVAPALARALEQVELVIEAVPESIELKRQIFAQVDGAAPPSALLASNTSSLSIGRIAEATKNPQRVIGMHFFNPVPLMPLLEIVRSDASADESIERALAIARAMGKEPIVVRDSPGFATSRLGLVLGLEAMRMVEQQVASPEDIDKAMTLGYRHPMGPLRLTDLVGLDVRQAIAEHLHRELGSESFRPPEILRRLVAEGRLGKKTGRGFYDW